jgi:hypothetical protein
MTIQRTDFPVFEASYARALGDPPVMLDGMEVVFDKTVGLAPVTLVAKRGKVTTNEVARD